MAKTPRKVKKGVKKTKVMTVPVPKAEASNEADLQVNALKSLVASAGWAIIVRILDENIAYLEKAILEKKDPASGLELTDEEVEKLRYKRGLNIELKGTPGKYSQTLLDIEKVPENFDPYWNMDDLRKHEKSSLKTE